jgi:hypothetical protein
MVSVVGQYNFRQVESAARAVVERVSDSCCCYVLMKLRQESIAWRYRNADVQAQALSLGIVEACLALKT